MIAVATVMASLENLIQPPLPFLRLGLANGITLLVLKWWGFRPAVMITVARVILAGLIIGRLFQPVFLMSLTGGLTAACVMGLLMIGAGRWLSLVGISILGALAHNLAQMAVASLLVHQWIGVSLLPVLLIMSLISGTLIGYFALLVDRAFQAHLR